jgi:predicted nucleotidyltransferase
MLEPAGFDRLGRVCSDYGILAAYAFGSMAERVNPLLEGEEPGEVADLLADLDIGVVFYEKPPTPAERIRLYGKLYSKLSDVFSPFPLDLVFLQETGVVLQFEAINGVVIYSADDDRRLDYEERVIKFYQDWKPDYDRYVKEVLEAISG